MVYYCIYYRFFMSLNILFNICYMFLVGVPSHKLPIVPLSHKEPNLWMLQSVNLSLFISSILAS